jgi:hypothetical protein
LGQLYNQYGESLFANIDWGKKRIMNVCPSVIKPRFMYFPLNLLIKDFPAPFIPSLGLDTESAAQMLILLCFSEKKQDPKCHLEVSSYN